MQAVESFIAPQLKAALTAVRSGDTVRVHQLIREGSKKRVQIFEGVVIRTRHLGEISAALTVRRIASGVGVEKTFLLHSPNLSRVEVIRRAKVRRNFLSYLRERRGKSARLQEVDSDLAAVNVVAESPKAEKSTDLDEELTELDAATDIKADEEVDLDHASKPEKKAAASDEPSQDPDDTTDEETLAAKEFESGVDRVQPENK